MELIGLIGLTAAVCTTASFFPQALRVLRTRDTRSISLSMYIIFTLGLMLWLAYGVMRGDLPIILANIFTLLPAAVILAFKIGEKRRE